MHTAPLQLTQSFLYARLSSFYFFYFATLGIFIPYWSLYLKALGFNAVEIGELMAMVMASKLIAPYLLGWLSDHIQKRLVIIQISLFLVLVNAVLSCKQSSCYCIWKCFGNELNRFVYYLPFKLFVLSH